MESPRSAREGRGLLPVATLLLVLSSLAAAVVGASERSGMAVEGRDRVVLRLPAGASFEPTRREGYALTLGRDSRATVQVEVTPWATSVGLAPAARGSEGGALDVLASRLAVGVHDRFEASRRVQSWMARNLEYRLDRSQDQTPAVVLERRSGYCTGIARLAVELLRRVGVPAREVAGVVGEGPDVGYHRWIEVELADGKWFFSDPLRYHHFVPATYVPLASEVVFSRAPDLEILSRDQAFELVGELPEKAPDVFGRGAGGWAGHVVQLVDPERVVLSYPGMERLRLRLDGRRWRRTVEMPNGLVTGFAGLPGGSYVLILEGWPRSQVAAGPDATDGAASSWQQIGGALRIAIEERSPMQLQGDELLARINED